MASFTADDVQRALAPLANEELFQRLQTPKFRPEFGEDRNDEASIWIYVLIPDEVPPELVRGAHFEEQFRIRTALQDAGWNGWVYVRFRLASDDPLPYSAVTTK
jgi:hypothetical protein